MTTINFGIATMLASFVDKENPEKSWYLGFPLIAVFVLSTVATILAEVKYGLESKEEERLEALCHKHCLCL